MFRAFVSSIIARVLVYCQSIIRQLGFRNVALACMGPRIYIRGIASAIHDTDECESFMYYLRENFGRAASQVTAADNFSVDCGVTCAGQQLRT